MTHPTGSTHSYPGSTHRGTTGVTLSRGYRAAGPQVVGCGHVIDKGAELFELKGGGGALGTLCRPCLLDLGAQVANLDSIDAR